MPLPRPDGDAVIRVPVRTKSIVEFLIPLMSMSVSCRKSYVMTSIFRDVAHNSLDWNLDGVMPIGYNALKSTALQLSMPFLITLQISFHLLHYSDTTTTLSSESTPTHTPSLIPHQVSRWSVKVSIEKWGIQQSIKNRGEVACRRGLQCLGRHCTCVCCARYLLLSLQVILKRTCHLEQSRASLLLLLLATWEE